MGTQTSFPPLLTSRVKKTLGAQSSGEDTALPEAGFPISSHTALWVYLFYSTVSLDKKEVAFANALTLSKLQSKIAASFNAKV